MHKLLSIKSYMKKSLKVVSKNNSCAMNCLICECERSPIIKVRVP